jgi:hypothetical protein
MQATISVRIGEHEIALPILRSTHQKLRYLREYFDAVDAHQKLPKEAPLTASLEAIADVEVAVAAGILRMLPKGHPWRERYDADTYQSSADPWRDMGADLLELAESEGVGARDLDAALQAMLAAAGASPTEAQVEVERGNSDATLS